MTDVPASKPPGPPKAKPGAAAAPVAASTPAAAAPAAKAAPAATNKKSWGSDVISVDIIANEGVELIRHSRLMSVATIEAVIIAFLCLVLMLGIPFFQPIYQYYALNPQQQRLPMAALNVPNMTNRAILSWSTISITEIMTMGFGDYEPHLKAQKFRFTDAGWESFATAFDKQKIGDAFRKHQLVLTTIPSNTPIITAQGENSHHIYQWNVQMPVVMTYATNDNVSTRQNAVINLMIVRVPTEQNIEGIGIKTWSVN